MTKWCQWRALNQPRGTDIAATFGHMSIYALQWNAGSLWMFVDIITTQTLSLSFFQVLGTLSG